MKSEATPPRFSLKKVGLILTLILPLIFTSCGEPEITLNPLSNNINLLIKTSTLTPNSEYPNGGTITQIGLDENNDNILSDDEITNTIIYETDNSSNTLIEVNNENVTFNCSNGGQAINIGEDTNQNNILDLSEITNTEFICNDDTPNLTIISNESSDSDCLNGCIQIETGIDSNQNEILDPDEIVSSIIINNENPVDHSGNASIRGIVKDANTDLPLEDVTITLLSNNQEIINLSTNNSGIYLIENISSDITYEIIYNLDGYSEATRAEVNINPHVINFIETTLLISNDNTSDGNIEGLITNAFTGIGESNVSLNIREGLGNLDGDVIDTTVSSSNGNYSFNNLSPGNYTIEISKNSFITTSFSVQVLSGATNENQNGTISPIIAEGEIRIVLEWQVDPRDLDSHLTGPLENGERFHTYYADNNPFNSNSSLDVDDVSSFGPETITINETIDGVYRYSVHNFSSFSSAITLENSSAVVRLYIGDTNLTFNVPNGNGDLWTVFEIDGSNFTVTPINSITNVTNNSSFKRVESQNDSHLIKNIPSK